MSSGLGSGDFVSVTHGGAKVSGVSAGFVNGVNYIEAKYGQQKSIVDDMQNRVLTALESLLTQVNNITLPSGWRDPLDNVVIRDVEEIDRGATGTVPTLTLPDDWPTNNPVLGYLKPAPQDDLTMQTFDAPDEPTRDIAYQENTYQSVIFQDLYTVIYNGLNDPTKPIFSDEVQDAIYAQGRQRLKSAKDEAWQTAMDAIGSDGFDLPGGAEASILGTVIAKNLESDETLNRDLYIKMAELADLNVRFMVDKAEVLEQILRDFHNNRENRTLDAEKSIAQFFLTKYDTAVRVYATKYDAEKARLEALVKKVEVIFQENELTLRKYLGELDGKKAETDLVATKTNAIVDGFKGEIEAFKAQQQEKTDWWKALTDQQQRNIEADELKLRHAIAEVENLIQGTLSNDQLKASITNDVAAIMAQILASALASVNTGINHSTSVSESLSESLSASASIGESHSYDETKTS